MKYMKYLHDCFDDACEHPYVHIVVLLTGLAIGEAVKLWWVLR